MIIIKQTMGLTLLKQKHNELQAHTHPITEACVCRYVPAEKEQEYTKVLLSTQKSTHLLSSSAEDFSSWRTSRGAPTHTRPRKHRTKPCLRSRVSSSPSETQNDMLRRTDCFRLRGIADSPKMVSFSLGLSPAKTAF